MRNPDEYKKRLDAWRESSMTRLKKKWPWLTLIGVVVLGGLGTLIDNRLWLKLDPVLTFVLDWLRFIVTLPLWAGGLPLFLYLGWLATKAYFESGPKPNDVRRSEADRNEIERIREMWAGEAECACEGIGRLLRDAVDYIVKNGVPFAVVLREKQNRLTQASMALAQSFNSTVPLDEVQTRLTAVLQAYLDNVAWFNLCMAYDLGLPPETKAPTKYSEWIALHTAFSKEVERLSRRSAASTRGQLLDEDPRRILLQGQAWGEFNLVAPRAVITKPPLLGPDTAAGPSSGFVS